MIILAWIGTVFCSMAFGDGYIFTKELNPTPIRTTALSTASASARIGSIISPFIGMLDEYDEMAPLAVYGLIVLLCGCGSIFIWPGKQFSFNFNIETQITNVCFFVETSSIRLPDTIEESERIARSQNKWVATLKCQKTTDSTVYPRKRSTEKV